MALMEFFTLTTCLTLLTLTGLEIVLGIDNVVFIALLIQKLPAHKQKQVRCFGIALALVLRIVMLFAATSIAKMVHPLFFLGHMAVTGRDILLFLGGVFLLYKGWKEFTEIAASSEDHPEKITPRESFFGVVMQVVFIDFVLSFDSIITAVGITTDLPIMVIAVVISMIIMLFSVGPIGTFIESNPRIRVIAISFVMLVGVYLVASGLHYEIEKAYLYSAMGFATLIECINIRLGIGNTHHKGTL